MTVFEIMVSLILLSVLLLTLYGVNERRKQNERYKRKEDDHRQFNHKRGIK